MKFAIIIPTYQRKDLKTRELLTRCLSSIVNQFYKEYRVFLIGDKYEDSKELIELSKIIPENKMHLFNMEKALEREKYSGHRLWCTGGLAATNFATELALSKGYKYVCYLDHDDWWEKNHLTEISKAFEENEYSLVCTKSTHISGKVLPTANTSSYYPTCGDLIKSSVCINFNKLNGFRFRNVYEETGKDFPSDCDMWIRISQYMKTNNLLGKLINVVTCNHPTEGYSKK